MTGRANTLVRNEYWIRCPECGDSAKPNKAHLSINVDSGAFYCFRCGWGGYLRLSQLLTLISQTGIDVNMSLENPSEDPELPKLEIGPGANRYSLLERYHIFDPNDGGMWDGFVYRDPRGRPTGYLLRRGDKAINYGRRTYLYPDPLGGPSTILRIVEGPYDVLYPEDMAVGGLIRANVVCRDLTPYQFIFCPDGDIWINDELRRVFLKSLYPALKRGVVVGVEYLPDGKDPDEVPVGKREIFTPEQMLKLCEKVRRI